MISQIEILNMRMKSAHTHRKAPFEVVLPISRSQRKTHGVSEIERDRERDIHSSTFGLMFNKEDRWPCGEFINQGLWLAC